MSTASSFNDKIPANTEAVPVTGDDLQAVTQDTTQQHTQAVNPTPLDSGAFAVTTFVLSCVNLGARKVHEPNLVVALAYAYGGLIQLLAGMWEMAVGNTFGATTLSSYGGFWISLAMILTPAFGIVDAYTEKSTGISTFHDVFAIYLWVWFFFTSLCTLLTLRSTAAIASLFIVLDATFLCLALAEMRIIKSPSSAGALAKVGGAFGLATALLAWYNMFAGMANDTNFWFKIPVGHLPWSKKEKKKNIERSQV